MFANSISPSELVPAQLDVYLQQGWFRMGQSIFTTHFIRFKDQLFSTIWLRVELHKFLPDALQNKLVKKNSSFTSIIQPATLTEEKENLYTRYRSQRSFNPSPSLHDLLLGQSSSHSIYQTYEVAIHDKGNLIAIGFFDVGETSAAGIVSIYDPAYKKHSLGKHLIYLKIQYCQMLGLKYFYPGYFVPGYSLFDYKLSIGNYALEFLALSRTQWLPINHFSQHHIAINEMRIMLKTVQQDLTVLEVDTAILNYEFFDASLLPDLRDAGLFDFPVFLHASARPFNGSQLVLVFDIRDSLFHLFWCIPVWQVEKVNPDKNFYSTYFLKIASTLYVTSSIHEAASAFKNSLEL
jgi:leucyl-tRNA---protein transferase